MNKFFKLGTIFLGVATLFACHIIPKHNPEDYVTTDGAYCWFSSPRAIYVVDKEGKDRILTGWIKEDGTVEAGLINPMSKKAQTFVLADKMEVDDHDNPSFLALADGNWMVCYGKHATKEGIRMRKTTKPGDFTSWGAEKKLSLNNLKQYEGKEFYEEAKNHLDYTYSNPYQLKEFTAEGKKAPRIYLFWRGLHYKPNLSYSDDNGETWADGQIVVMKNPKSTNTRPYARYFSDYKKTIHMIFTDGHPRDEKNNSVYYVKLVGDQFQKADGTPIATLNQLPIDLEKTGVVDKVYDGSTKGRAWVWDVKADATGNPIVAYTRCPKEDQHEYWVAIYQKSSNTWKQVQIADGGKWFPQTPACKKEPEPHYSGGISIDVTDWKTIYYSSNAEDGQSRLYQVTLKDDLSAFNAPILVQKSNANLDQVRPVSIVGRPTKEGLPKVMWMENFYYTYWTQFRSGVCVK